MAHTRTHLVCLALALAIAAPARAEPRSFPLDPAHAEIGFRAYAFGVVPRDGVFGKFSGTLTFDPAAPAKCRVEISVDVASLRMPDPATRAAVLSPDLLDASTYPNFSYAGNCDDDGIDGALTLHGTTHPLHLAIVNTPPRYTAQAMLRRREWGIDGRPVWVGPSVRIRVSTTLSP